MAGLKSQQIAYQGHLVMWLIREYIVRRSHRKIKALISTAILAAVITGCQTPMPSAGPTPFNHKIQIAESIERLELYTRPTGLELSARDQVAVTQFLEAYSHQGEGPIYINTPSSSAHGLGAQQAQAVIRQSLGRMGLAGAPVQTGQYQAAYGAPAPVVVSYRTLKTVPQDCRKMGDLAYTYTNQPDSSFGCFHSANLAAMIQDPRQLIQPYDMTVPDSQRRQTIYDKYIKGENPASEHPDRQDITVEDK